MQQDIHAPVTLSQAGQECLRCIVGHMIPASEAFGVPGADDPVIFADMVRSIRRDGDALSAALGAVDRAAGGRLVEMQPAERAVLLARLRTENPGMLGLVEAIASRAYYRDDRVLKSIGMENRPPFPKGYEVAQGDWSLLDPVRNRAPMYRNAG